MAERPGVESVLSRIDDLSGRLATAKTLGDVQETIGRLATTKAVIDLQETLTKLLAEIKGIRDRMVELEESTTKGLRKLREEVLEAVESVEAGEVDDSEPPEWIKPLLPAFQERLGWLFDKDVGDALKGKIKGWIQSKGKKALGGDDE